MSPLNLLWEQLLLYNVCMLWPVLDPFFDIREVSHPLAQALEERVVVQCNTHQRHLVKELEESNVCPGNGVPGKVLATPRLKARG